MGRPTRRQWEMLQLIPKEPRSISVRDLTEKLQERGYTPTLRTVQRDLLNLEDSFRLICDDESKPYQWSLPRQSQVQSIPGMDIVTALTFHLTDHFISGLLPPPAREVFRPYLEQAHSVLDESGQRSLAKWPSRVAVIPPGQRLKAPRVDGEVLDAVYEALLKQRRLSLSYRPRMRGGDATFHPSASPLGLVVRSNVTYLVCHLHKGPDPSHLALHRIESAEVLDEPTTVAKGFDLQAYVAKGFLDYPVGKNIRLIARFSPETAPHLLECHLSDDQKHKAESNGWVQIKATVQDTQQLRWWLQGFGPRVEVLSPKTLRQAMAEELKNAAALYADPS